MRLPVVLLTESIGEIKRIAGLVRGAGIGRDDVTAVLMADGTEMLLTVLGVSEACPCAPVNPALRAEEVRAILQGLGARLVICDSQFLELVQDSGVPALTPAGLQSVLPADVPAADDSDLALILQTSATTSDKPRLVPMTHGNLRAMASNTAEILQLGPSDRFLCMMPLFHLQGLLSSIAQLIAGGGVIATSGFDAGAFLEWMSEFRPTWYTASPTLHHAILSLLESRGTTVDGLRFVRSIGAPMQQHLHANLERVLGCPVLEGYGMTEAGMVTSNEPPPMKRVPGSAGRSASRMELGILDDAGHPLPPGREGEIAVRGPAVITGYYNDPAANREAFQNGWFLSGDIGSVDDEGYLFVSGRKKDIINRGGEKVLPAEVDEALCAHPMVAEAVAFGVPHPTLGEDVAAAVVLRGTVSDSELRHFVAERVASYKVPRRIVFVDSIPKGPTGKARRSELAQQFAVAPNRGDASVASPFEKTLASIWQRILRSESEPGPELDFFEAGGDSLALTLLMTEIDYQFGVRIGDVLEGADFFAEPTIRTLARIIEEERAESRSGQRMPLTALQREGARNPFFCIPGADENPYYLVDLAKALGQDRPFYVPRDPRTMEERGVYSLEEHAAHYRDVIRSAKPQGPYLLGGHCYGGILAYEIARQLTEQGEKVELLALFEVPTPGYPKVVGNWKRYLQQIRRLMRGEAQASWRDVLSHASVVAGIWRRDLVSAVRRRFFHTGLRRTVAQVETPGFNRNFAAARAYVPGLLNAKVVQFIAAHEPHSTQVLDDPRMGWRESVVGGGFSVVEVPTLATEMFQPPHAAALAERFRNVVDTTEQSRSRPLLEGRGNRAERKQPHARSIGAGH